MAGLKEGEAVLSRTATPSEAIMLEIAEQTGVDPLDLPSLSESFDPEALDRLVQGPGSCRVTFEYTGYKVTVYETGCIAIDELEND